jgi:hypothetical protein
MDALRKDIADLTKQMAELVNVIEKSKLTSQRECDQRYQLRDDLDSDAISLFDNPSFRRHAEEFVADSLTGDKCKKAVCYIINEHIRNGRDGLLSWVNLIKAIGGVAIGYVAYSLISNQSAIMQTLQTLK